MKAPALFASLAVACSAMAQLPVDPTKPDPFAKFGNTGLDRRPTANTMPARPASAPMPTTSSQEAPRRKPPKGPPDGNSGPTGPGGLALAASHTGALDEAVGGQGMKMDDLQALLASYGKPMDDLAAHPSAVIYDGAPMDPAVGAKCTVKYLMPLDEAEGALMKNRGLASVMPAVSPGFPAGLFIHVYDVRFGIYNRLHLLTDSAKPQPQVVAMLLQAQGVNYYPASPPFEKLERNWHTLDYVNTVNRGQGGIVIDTRVLDLRRQNYSIVVNTTGGFWPPITEAVLRKPAVAPKETDTWYVPQPLINLMLYSLSKSTHH